MRVAYVTMYVHTETIHVVSTRTNVLLNFVKVTGFVTVRMKVVFIVSVIIIRNIHAHVISNQLQVILIIAIIHVQVMNVTASIIRTFAHVIGILAVV